MSANPKWADLALRSLSAVLLMPLALYFIWQGGILFHMFLGIVAVLLAFEWATIVHGGGERAFAILALGGLSGVFVTQSHGLDAASIAILMVWLLSVFMWLAQAGQGSIWSLLGVYYIALPMVAFVLLRGDGEWGLWAVLWCFLIVWAADICAYFAGRIIGGPKLAPKLSPKKTWAGLGGAMVGAAIISAIFALALNLNVFALALIAAGMAIVEQGGDILESALKRRYNVKDSGDLIPGHGGVLDRLDGLLAVVLLAAIIGSMHHSGAPAAGLLLW